MRTSAPSRLRWYRDVDILLVVAIKRFEIFPDPRFLAGREVGEAQGRLVTGGALSVGGLQRGGKRRPRVRYVGPSRRAFRGGARDFNDTEVVHVVLGRVVGLKGRGSGSRSGDF